MLRRLVATSLLVVLPLASAAASDVAAVLNRVVYPGETIGAEAIDEVVHKPSVRNAVKLSAPVAVESRQLEGKVAKRTLLPGTLVPLSSVREPWAVDAGVPITVRFVRGGLTISATAVALAPGAIGDLVRLRNVDSGKVVSGVVLADGTVRVGQ